jgi:sortase A
VLAAGAYFVLDENARIEALQQKSADVQRDADALRATPTPAPELSIRLSDYVLPSGHYSPDVTGGQPVFNIDELPESVRPAAMAQLMAPQAERIEQEPSQPNRIVIDTARVHVDASIYGGDDWYQLVKGVGHVEGSANPGERANMVLTAHNDIYGEIFRYIQYLEPGDEIRVQARDNRWYTYVVFDKEIVAPTEVRVLGRGNEPIVTLITCHPYRVDNKRMIVYGRLKED